jgi:glycosyltransferase involved in cell wall biosynthesis
MEQLSSLSVFFPAHNEKGNIGPLTRKTVEFLRSKGIEFEVLIINDGSTDGTREVADCLAGEFSEVRAVHHEHNLGYGGAVWTGIRESRFEAVFFTDGDGQFDIRELDLFFPHYGSCDAVLGYRIKRADPFHRLVFAKCWGLLIVLLFGLRFKDLDCAFKLIRRDLLVDLKQETGGAMVTVELMYKLKRKGMRYHQVGVHHYPRVSGQQSGGSPRVILRAFKELFATFLKLRAG